MIIYTTINHPGIKENKLSSLLRWQCKYYLSNTTWSIHHLTQLKRNQSSAGAPVVKSSANQQQATDISYNTSTASSAATHPEERSKYCHFPKSTNKYYPASMDHRPHRLSNQPSSYQYEVGGDCK